MPISKKIEGVLARSSFIRKMFEEGERLRSIYGADKVFDFSLGNPDVEPPQKFKDELKRLALNPIPGMHRYMTNAGYYETRAAIANTLARETSLPFKADHVCMTVGAGGALNTILKTLLDDGEEVIVFKPYFVEYDFYVGNHGGKVVVVPTDANFLPDLDRLSEAINPMTKVVLINSPNNPTGVVYSKEVLDGLGKVLKEKEAEYKKDIYLVSDEPYAKIVYDGVKVPSIFNAHVNSILATSYSKDLSLPGERIGYLAPHPLMNNVELMMNGIIFANRTLGYVNAPALMQRIVTNLQNETVNTDIYRKRRDTLYNHLTSIGFEMVKPQGAFYLFPKSPLPDEMDFIRAAQKHNILVVPGGGFGQPGYFRICYAVDDQLIQNSLPYFTALAKEVGIYK